MKVIKRDGTLQDFNIEKIKKCLEEANKDVDEEDRVEGASFTKLIKSIQGRIAERAVIDISNDQIIDLSVEEIQDIIENELIRLNKYNLAKHYIKYRYQHQKVRETEDTLINYKKVVDSYLKVSDWRVKENSTVSYSLGGLILSNSGAVTANYWLSEVYDDEVANAHRNADIHIHDLSMLAPYCAGWSLKQLIQEGLGGVLGKITSSPASHLSTLCNQMVNFLGIMQNEWAGAQAFSSFDTYLAPFVKVDNLSYKEVKQCIQSFVYGVNTPSRWGTQAPFTNITLDWTVPSDLAELNAIVGGKEMDFKYKDCKKEMDMVNKAFIEIMIEGDANGRGFQYPIEVVVA
jgi:ribonucleoside-triphosphate reductase